MKVTTDACLFGAVVAKEVSSSGRVDVLDIGAGTGLLPLMVAQQNTECLIDAIEIDEAAAAQAAENAAASPWSNRVRVLHADLLEYQTDKSYDIIISNPPFYEGQLKSPKLGRQVAHHSSNLSLQQLLQEIEKLLKPEGNFFVLLPYFRTEEVISTAKECSLYAHMHWLIRQTPRHDFFRSILQFSFQGLSDYPSITICIEEQRNVYSPTFSDLLKPYYLKL